MGYGVLPITATKRKSWQRNRLRLKDIEMLIVPSDRDEPFLLTPDHPERPNCPISLTEMKAWFENHGPQKQRSWNYAPSALRARSFRIVEALTVGFGITAHSSSRLQT
jgi:hypothetical protein